MLKITDFKVGMKVRAIEDKPCGLVGEIVTIDVAFDALGVAFEGFDGHNCDCLKKNNGWWLRVDQVEIISEEGCTCPTAEQDNIDEICAKSEPRLRLLSAYEAYEQAIQMKQDALDEIKQILEEMESN